MIEKVVPFAVILLLVLYSCRSDRRLCVLGLTGAGLIAYAQFRGEPQPWEAVLVVAVAVAFILYTLSR